MRRTTTTTAAAVAIACVVLAGCSAEPQAAPSPSATPSPSAEAEAPAPGLASIDAERGGLVGGGEVTLAGTALAGVDAVRFGEAEATVLEAGDDAVRVEVPPAVDFRAGEVEVSAWSGGERVDGRAAYAYEIVDPVDRQMAYLFDHWEDYNTAEWGDLNPVGGDCANFTSQGLIERGWEQRGDWYNRDQAADWTPSWGYVPAMEGWFEANADELGVERIGGDERERVSIGDIGMFDWDDNGNPDHVMTVSSIDEGEDGELKIGFVSHNLDGQYRDLDVAITEEHPGGTAWFWAVED